MHRAHLCHTVCLFNHGPQHASNGFCSPGSRLEVTVTNDGQMTTVQFWLFYSCDCLCFQSLALNTRPKTGQQHTQQQQYISCRSLLIDTSSSAFKACIRLSTTQKLSVTVRVSDLARLYMHASPPSTGAVQHTPKHLSSATLPAGPLCCVCSWLQQQAAVLLSPPAGAAG